MQLIPDLPDWIPADAWGGYVAMRKQIKKPLTDYAQKLAIGKLQDLMLQGQSVQAVLEQSIFNSWQGLFAIKAEPQQQAALLRGQPTRLALVDQQRVNTDEANRLLFGDDEARTYDASR